MKPNPQPDPIKLLYTTLEAKLLKYSAGRTLCCPACQSILNWRTTVIVSIHAALPDKPEHIIKAYTQCGACWDKNRHHLDEGLAKVRAKIPDAQLRTEIVDGREERFNCID